MAYETVIERGSQGKDIGAVVHFVVLDLLRRTIKRSTKHGALFGETSRRITNRAKVNKLGMATTIKTFPDEDIRRFDIAVNQSVTVYFLKGFTNI